MGDRMFNAMLRGFGYSVGRRAAYKFPLWLGVLIVVGFYLLKS